MTGLSATPPVSDRLWREITSLLPTGLETTFITAATRQGDRGRDAWRQWLGAMTPPPHTPGPRTLAPLNAFVALLGWNLRRNGVELSPALWTYIRAAQATDDLRWRKYQHAAAAAFDAFDAAGIPFIVLKGAAFGEGYYPSPELRHTGDVDVLVSPHQLDAAAAALVASGWTRGKAESFMARHMRHLPPVVHPSGLPLELHRGLAVSYYTLPYALLWQRSVWASVAGRRVRVLGPEDSLLHMCLHGMGGERWLRWIIDACFLFEKHDGLDWDVFLNTTAQARAALPMHAALTYLARQMDAPIPARVLGATHAAAAQSGFIAKRVARPIPSGAPGEIWRSDDSIWRRVGRLVRRAVPSPIDLAVQFDIPIWQVPFDYVHRVIRYTRYVLQRGDRPAA